MEKLQDGSRFIWVLTTRIIFLLRAQAVAIRNPRSNMILQTASWPTRIVSSGGANAVKEPDHFEVRTSSSQVTRMYFFSQKSWRPFFLFLVVALKTQRPPTPLRLFYCQNKTYKAVSGQIWYFSSFCSHCYRSKAKQ